MTEPAFDLITMGRCSIDLYSNSIGAPFVEIESFGAFVGGSPTNIAVGAQRLGLHAALLTAVGEDLVGDFVLHFLEKEGVTTRYIPRKSGTRTPAVLLGIQPPDKFPLVFYRENASDLQLTISDAQAVPLDRTRAFEFAGTNLARDPERSATLFAAEEAKRHGASVYLDLDFRADQWHDLRAFGIAVRSVLPLIEVAIGTEEEIKAAALTEPGAVQIVDSQITAPSVAGELSEAIAALLDSGLSALVVKRGAHGAQVHLAGGETIEAPGFVVEVLNVLGAGDAFASGLIYGRLQGWDWYRSARFGNACGAIVVTRAGVANFMPYQQEALDFVEAQGGF